MVPSGPPDARPRSRSTQANQARSQPRRHPVAAPRRDRASPSRHTPWGRARQTSQTDAHRLLHQPRLWHRDPTRYPTGKYQNVQPAGLLCGERSSGGEWELRASSFPFARPHDHPDVTARTDPTRSCKKSHEGDGLRSRRIARASDLLASHTVTYFVRLASLAGQPSVRPVSKMGQNPLRCSGRPA